MSFEVADGEESHRDRRTDEYVIRVGRSSAKAASGVQALGERFLGDLEPIEAKGPAAASCRDSDRAFRTSGHGSRRREGRAGATASVLRGHREGDQRVQVQITSDDQVAAPITKEEVARVSSPNRWSGTLLSEHLSSTPGAEAEGGSAGNASRGIGHSLLPGDNLQDPRSGDLRRPGAGLEPSRSCAPAAWRTTWRGRRRRSPGRPHAGLLRGERARGASEPERRDQRLLARCRPLGVLPDLREPAVLEQRPGCTRIAAAMSAQATVSATTRLMSLDGRKIAGPHKRPFPSHGEVEPIETNLDAATGPSRPKERRVAGATSPMIPTRRPACPGRTSRISAVRPGANSPMACGRYSMRASSPAASMPEPQASHRRGPWQRVAASDHERCQKRLFHGRFDAQIVGR